MQLLPLFLLASATLSFAAPYAQEHEHPPGEEHPGEPEAPEPPATGAVPEGFKLEIPLDPQKPLTPGATVIKQRLGPWSLAPGAELSNRPVRFDKPCNDCFLVGIQAGLEYEDGSEANIDTGAWMHHMVLSSSGTGENDPVCPSRILQRRRIYAAGNERTAKRFNDAGKFGIKIDKADKMSMIMELMNEGTDTKTLYLTMTYEFVIGTAADGYKDAQLIWLDATGCGASSVPAQQGEYQLKTPVFTSKIAGKMLFGVGHTHDGGVNVTIYQNGEPACVSKMAYGHKPGFVAPDNGGHDDGHGGHMKMQHISGSGICKNFGDIKVGDQFYAVSQYDSNKYPQMMHEGKMHPVMGNANIYVGPA